MLSLGVCQGGMVGFKNMILNRSPGMFFYIQSFFSYFVQFPNRYKIGVRVISPQI